MGVALTSQNVTRAKGVWLCLSPSFCFYHRYPTSPVELFLSYLPLLLRANSPYHVSSFDIIEAYFYAQTPTGYILYPHDYLCPAAFIAYSPSSLSSFSWLLLDQPLCMQGVYPQAQMSLVQQNTIDQPTKYVCGIRHFYLDIEEKSIFRFFFVIDNKYNIKNKPFILPNTTDFVFCKYL